MPLDAAVLNRLITTRAIAEIFYLSNLIKYYKNTILSASCKHSLLMQSYNALLQNRYLILLKYNTIILDYLDRLIKKPIYLKLSYIFLYIPSAC